MRKFTCLLFVLTLLMTGHIAIAQRITMTIAGTGLTGHSGDNGPAKLARITGPKYICADPQDNIYFVDYYSLRQISAKTGLMRTVVGGIWISHICCDRFGNIYAVLSGNMIKKIDPSTGILTNFAGSATAGYSGDGLTATAAKFNGIAGIAADHSGNIYVMDSGNHRVRMINITTGIVNTVGGTGVAGYSGDGGPATAATINNSNYLTCNSLGDIFFADQSTYYIRKIDGATGYMYAYAGGTSGLDHCPATTATLGPVSGLCVNNSGNLCFDETSCSCREINHATDSLEFIGGNFTTEAYKDDTNSLQAWMNNNYGITQDTHDNLYIADAGNNRIRKMIKLTHIPTFAYGKGQTINACPGYTYTVDSLLAITDLDAGQTETWSVITPPSVGTLSGLPAAALSNSTYKTTKPFGVSYLAPVTYSGVDSFTIRVSDGTQADTFNVYVRVQMPDPGSISGASILCGTDTASLGESVLYGVWTSSNASATIDSLSGLMTAVAPGVDTITYSLAGSCIVTTTKVVTITPMPAAGIILGSNSMCEGATIILSDVLGMVGGTWGASNSHMSVSGVGEFIAVSPGVDTVRYSVTNACGTNVSKKAITVMPLPDAGTISGANTICELGTLTLSDAATGGTWATVNGFVTVSGATYVTGVLAGVDTIKYTVTNSCGVATAVLVITVNPLPDPGAISGAEDVCIGATIVLTDLVGGGMWSQTNPSTIIAAPGSFVGLSAGMDTILYAVTNSCGASFASKVITVSDCDIAGVKPVPMPEVSIFPNPASSLLTIRWGNWKEENAVIVIRDVTGREVLRTAIVNPGNAGSPQIGLADIKDGVYLFTVSSGSQYFSEKLVIKK